MSGKKQNLIDIDRILLDVKGMTCKSCETHIENALKNVPGTIDINIPDWELGIAVVFAKSETSDKELIEKISEAGYSGSVLKREKINKVLKTRRKKPAIDNKYIHSIDLKSGKISSNEVLDTQKAEVTKNMATKTISNIHFRKNKGKIITSNDDRKPDLLVIGGGSAGFAGAIKAAELGFSAVIVEKGIIGGTCVNRGCVPSKALIHAVNHFYNAKNNRFRGIKTTAESINWKEVIQHKNELVNSLRSAKYEDVLDAYSSIRYINGLAEFSEKGILINGENYNPGKILIATGAKPWIPEIQGLRDVNYLTSTTAMELENLPESLIVLGANAVGLELSQIFSRAGSRVTILEIKPRITPELDSTISDELRKYLKEDGINIITDFKTISVNKDKNGVQIIGESMGKEIKLSSEKILVATGRKPDTSSLKLEKAGIQIGGKGEILVDDELKTTNPNVYAAGDVTGKDQYVYVAAYSAGLAVENALTNAGKRYDTSYIPRIIFTDPQVATAGLSEPEAELKGYKVKTVMLPMKHVPKAQASRDIRGFIKIIVDRNSERLLGVHIIGHDAAEMVQSGVLAIRFGLTVKEIKETIFPYLTANEGLKLAVLSLEKEIAKLSCCAV